MPTNRREVLAAIKKALDAIDAYEKQSLQKSVTTDDRMLNSQIHTESHRLFEVLAKSLALGPSGSPCPRCGGSGRI